MYRVNVISRKGCKVIKSNHYKSGEFAEKIASELEQIVPSVRAVIYECDGFRAKSFELVKG